VVPIWRDVALAGDVIRAHNYTPVVRVDAERLTGRHGRMLAAVARPQPALMRWLMGPTGR
jgi:hypothetical protein